MSDRTDRAERTPDEGDSAPRKRSRLVFWVAIGLIVVLALGAGIAALVTTTGNSTGSTPTTTTPAAAATASPTTATFPYSSKEFGFSAKFSGKPTEIANDQVIGEATIHVGSVQFASDTAAEIISSAPMPDASLAMDRDDFLTNSFVGAVANVAGATAGATKFFTLKGERALEGSFLTNAGEMVNVVVTVHNGVQFLVIDGSTAADHKKFLDSFAFVG